MMGCCFGSFDDDYDYRRDNYSYQAGNSRDRQSPSQKRTGPEESQEEKREKARVAAEKRLAVNQNRGVSHPSSHPTTLEARQRRLEEQERQAIVSGRAAQPGGLSETDIFNRKHSFPYH